MNNISFNGNLHFSTIPMKFNTQNSCVDNWTICDSNAFEGDVEVMENMLDIPRNSFRYDCEFDTNNIKAIENGGLLYHIPDTEYDAFFEFEKPLSDAKYTQLLSAYNSAQTSDNLDIFI